MRASASANPGALAGAVLSLVAPKRPSVAGRRRILKPGGASAAPAPSVSRSPLSLACARRQQLAAAPPLRLRTPVAPSARRRPPWWATAHLARLYGRQFGGGLDPANGAAARCAIGHAAADRAQGGAGDWRRTNRIVLDPELRNCGAMPERARRPDARDREARHEDAGVLSSDGHRVFGSNGAQSFALTGPKDSVIAHYALASQKATGLADRDSVPRTRKSLATTPTSTAWQIAGRGPCPGYSRFWGSLTSG